MSKNIIRVFSRKTKATPCDSAVRIGLMPDLFDQADEIHISVAFSWDLPWAEKAAKEWQVVAPVKMGGPALGEAGGDFTPGLYLKHGYTITSRGCPNRCWFCSVPSREGYQLRELTIKDGWILTDDNFLACSEKHIQAVFSMLSRQPHRPQFTGGLEAKLLTQQRAKELRQLVPDSLFFAYDTPDDLEPLRQAGKYLLEAGFTKASHVLRAYVLIGYRGDTFEKATERFRQCWEAGFMPMAMLFRDFEGKYSLEWKRFQREWANPIITACNLKKL